MNLLSILRALFSSKPTFDEFLEIHEPESIADVDRLRDTYEKLILSANFK